MRIRVDLRLVAVGLAVVLAGAIALRPVPEDRPVMMAGLYLAADGRSLADVSIFLCKADAPFPNCGGEKITAQEQAAVEDALKARPEIESYVFKDVRTAYTNFRREFPDDFEMITEADMPESFRVNLKPDAEAASLISAVEVLPGVANVIETKCLMERAGFLGTIKGFLGLRDTCATADVY